MLANTVIPIEQYPPVCYVYVEGDQIIGVVARGESGYRPAGPADDRYTNAEAAQALVDAHNNAIGVKPSQREAMVFGSMFGWDLPGADPAKYTKLDEVG